MRWAKIFSSLLHAGVHHLCLLWTPATPLKEGNLQIIAACFSCTSVIVAEYSAGNPKFHTVTMLEMDKLTHAPILLFLWSSSSLFAKSRGSSALPWEFQRQHFCENSSVWQVWQHLCPCLSWRAVSSSLCKTWPWIWTEQVEELYSSTEGQFDIFVCMTLSFP